MGLERGARSPRTEAPRTEQTVRKELLASIARQFEVFQDEFGTPGMQALADVLATEPNKLGETLATMEQTIPSRKEFQNAFLEVLEQEGFVRKAESFYIANLDRFREKGVLRAVSQRSPRFKPAGKYGAYAKQGAVAVAHDALSDIQVISEEDFANGVREPKPLFY